MEPGLRMQIFLHYASKLFFLVSLPAMEDAKAVKYQACIMGIPWAGGMAGIQGYVQRRKKNIRKENNKERNKHRDVGGGKGGGGGKIRPRTSHRLFCYLGHHLMAPESFLLLLLLLFLLLITALTLGPKISTEHRLFYARYCTWALTLLARGLLCELRFV